MTKKKKVKASWKQVALDARNIVLKAVDGAKANKLALVIIALQCVTLWRVENVSNKLDALAGGIAQGLIMLYMNMAMMMSEIYTVLERILAIVTGHPA